jgi:serine/threonine protein kinase, bacterial
MNLINNRYQILETLGRGGFGQTFLAVDTHLPSGRKCVLKQLKPVNHDPDLQQWIEERFHREAAILEKLGSESPQIPQLYAYFAENGTFYLVQEWIEGVTLKQRQLQGKVSETEIREILINILPVLDYIHDYRIVHRDIKPENIILRNSDRLPVLIDFGAVKEAMQTVVYPDGSSPLSVAIGTPGYMPSEQAAGRPVYSSDLYSLGLTAVFLLTGKSPQLLESDRHTGEIIWRSEAPNISSNLADIIDRAISFHPRDRFSSAKEMLKALQPTPIYSNVATVAVAPSYNNSPLNSSNINQTEIARQPQKPKSKIWLKLIVSCLILGGLTGVALSIDWNDLSLFEEPEKTETQPEPPIEQTPPSPQPQPQPQPQPPQPQPQSPQPQSPQPQPSPEPTPSPEASPEPTPSPEVSPEPTPSPEVSPEPTPSPEVSPEPQPTSEPTPTPEVSPQN